jgi:hypothetical protein
MSTTSPIHHMRPFRVAAHAICGMSVHRLLG